MARSSQESQKLSFAISGALLLLLSLGYLFVPRADLGDKSPLAVLTSPTKKEIFTCAGGTSRGLKQLSESYQSESSCTKKYQGHWQKSLNNDGSVRTKGYGGSDVGNLISKDLPGTGGLFLLIGASPAIGFLVFQRISGTRNGTTTRKTNPSIVKDEKPATSTPPKSVPKELADRLEHLQSLHQKGLVTSEEFSIKKKELLEEI